MQLASAFDVQKLHAQQKLQGLTRTLNQARRAFHRARKHKAQNEMSQQAQKVKDLAIYLEIALFFYRVDFKHQTIH